MARLVRRMTVGMGCLFFAVSANGFASEKTFTVGIVNAVSSHEKTVEGFMAGMAELGY